MRREGGDINRRGRCCELHIVFRHGPVVVGRTIRTTDKRRYTLAQYARHVPILVEFHVVMTVRINKARCERKPSSVDNMFADQWLKIANLNNAIAVKTHVTGIRIVATAVVDLGIDDQRAARILPFRFTS